MPQFTVNPTRIDPYKNFKFRVSWDQGHYVAGVSRVSALVRHTNVVAFREGGDPHSMRKSPGQTDYGPITLERGVTFDTDFEKWANKVWDYKNSNQLGQTVSLADFRKDITIELYNIAGQKVLGYNVYRCWPSTYVALPELDSMANAVAIQSLTLENEGWDRDDAVPELPEPSFDDPKS